MARGVPSGILVIKKGEAKGTKTIKGTNFGKNEKIHCFDQKCTALSSGVTRICQKVRQGLSKNANFGILVQPRMV